MQDFNLSPSQLGASQRNMQDIKQLESQLRRFKIVNAKRSKETSEAKDEIIKLQ